MNPQMTPQPATQWIATSDRSPTAHDMPILVWMNQWCRTSEPLTLTKIEQFGPQYNWWKSLDRPPAPPPRDRDAFEQFCDTVCATTAERRWIKTGYTAATEAERARFSEGVDAILGEYDLLSSTLIADLRALAAGKDL